MIFFENIIGHGKQLRALGEDLATGNLAHAYLFTGPPHVGKFTIAKQLAKFLQCPTPLGDDPIRGVDNCVTCLSIEKGYPF